MSGWFDSGDLLVAVVAGAAVAAAVRLVVRPAPRLAARVRPYTVAARTSLGRSADVLAVADPSPLLSAGTLQGLLAPFVEGAAAALGRVLDRSGEEALLLRLRQAGLLGEVPEERRLQQHRLRQLQSGVVFAAVVGAAPLLAGASAALVVAMAAVGFIAGVARWRGRIDRAVNDRRDRMRVELYTINQLLAMHVRVGGGVVQATQRVVARGSGEVVAELAEVLRAHRGGRRMAEALQHAARVTPEPNAARTYKVLAGGVEYGADLADALLALSHDVRSQRTEALKRAATKRRAAMLVPIIAILAPVMLLFIAAPLPSLILGGF